MVTKYCRYNLEQFQKRKKCIKIADKSPAGWDTVKKYLSDELSSDSEDEKKIWYIVTQTLTNQVASSIRNKTVLKIKFDKYCLHNVLLVIILNIRIYYKNEYLDTIQ